MENNTTAYYGGYKPYSNPDPRFHPDLLKAQWRLLEYLKQRMLEKKEYVEVADIRNEQDELLELLKTKGVNISDVRTA